MRNFLSVVAACAFIAMPVSIVAQPDSQPADARQDAAGGNADQDKASKKKICKRIQSMGSRFSEKVCMTKAEWDAQENNAQDNAREERKR